MFLAQPGYTEEPYSFGKIEKTLEVVGCHDSGAFDSVQLLFAKEERRAALLLLGLYVTKGWCGKVTVFYVEEMHVRKQLESTGLTQGWITIGIRGKPYRARIFVPLIHPQVLDAFVGVAQ